MRIATLLLALLALAWLTEALALALALV